MVRKKGLKDTYIEYNKLLHCDTIEMETSFNQYSSGLMLKVWEEVSKLFIDFVTKIPSSPYQNVKSLFSIREYQSNSGNIAHTILAVDWEKLN